jgi:hypothetical protein
VEPLSNAVLDADGVGEAFKELGYKSILGLDIATKTEFDMLFAQLKASVSEHVDVIVFYFAGHGVRTLNGHVRLLLKKSLANDDQEPEHCILVEDLRCRLLELYCVRTRWYCCCSIAAAASLQQLHVRIVDTLPSRHSGTTNAPLPRSGRVPLG